MHGGRRVYKVLSIDGGGIRGVIPAFLLYRMEEEFGRPIAEMFDLIVGTSTGGIIAAGLTAPSALQAGQNVAPEPRHKASHILDLYVQHGRKIFDRSFWRGVTSVGGRTDEQYGHEALEKLLETYLEGTTLEDCITPIVVTSYDIERREPYFFKTERARKRKDRNHYLRDVARATSAAPTYFEPKVVKSLAQRPTRRVLVDGGVFANNPAMCAFAEAIESGVAMDDIILVSLGTGIAKRKIPYEDARDWGAIGWVRPVISIMMDGLADSADYQLKQLLPDRTAESKQRYFRFDTPLDLALDDIDAASAGNIRSLEDEARQILRENGDELARLKDLLVA